MKRQVNFIINITIALISGVVALIILSHFIKGNLYSTIELIKSVSLYVILFPILIYLLIYIIESLRLLIVLRIGGYNISFLNSLYNNIGGYFMSYITPSATGGQPFQVYHLTQIGVDSGYATSVIAARFLELTISNTIISIITLNTHLSWMISKGYLVLIGVFINIAFFILTLISLIKPKIIFPIVHAISKSFHAKNIEEKFFQWEENLKKSVKIMWGRNLPVMVLDFFLWIFVLFLQVFSFYIIISGITHHYINFLKFFGIIVTVTTLAFFIPTPGSSGGFETIYQFSIGPLYENSPQILTSILIWRLVCYYLQILLLGTALFLMGKFVKATNK